MPKAKKGAKVGHGIPHFVLSPLISLPPNVLDGSSPSDGFVLAMSVAFNDLKAFMWLLELMPEPGAQAGVTTTVGQIRGMRVFTTKMAMAIAHEVLEAIRSNRKRLMKDPLFTSAVGHLGGPAAKAWKALDTLAQLTPHKKGNSTRFALYRVRNSLASHYYNPTDLLHGYKAHFAQTHAVAKHAYVSAGPNMMHTRFYYADAAVQQGILVMTGAEIEKFNVVNRQINEGLRALIDAYLGQRIKVVKAEP